MDFVYHNRLGSHELRLLRPLSNSGRILSFVVSEVPRGSAPLYTAASYTWGNDEVSEVIYLDGRAFPVRPNLWSCLYYLSLAATSSAWNYIRADAICINQSDDVERSNQVSLMDQTYQNAVCVSAWLGLVPIPNEYNVFLSQHPSPKRVESDGFNWADSMADLANRPYWSRFWVIQEFLLGRYVELYCSDNQINWLEFQSILCREAGIDQFGDAMGNDDTHGSIDLHRALPLVMGRHVDKHPEMQQPLYDLIVLHHRSECKEQRDRVFALLGLIPLDERGLLGRFFPNYTIVDDHVLIITLAHLIMMRTCDGKPAITPDCEQLFLGLGVDSKAQRGRLLRRAEEFDYASDASPSDLLQILSFHDEMEQCAEVSWEEEPCVGLSWEAPLNNDGMRRSSFCTCGGFALGVIAVLLIFAAASKGVFYY